MTDFGGHPVLGPDIRLRTRYHLHHLYRDLWRDWRWWVLRCNSFTSVSSATATYHRQRPVCIQSLFNFVRRSASSSGQSTAIQRALLYGVVTCGRWSLVLCCAVQHRSASFGFDWNHGGGGNNNHGQRQYRGKKYAKHTPIVMCSVYRLAKKEKRCFDFFPSFSFLFFLLLFSKRGVTFIYLFFVYSTAIFCTAHAACPTVRYVRSSARASLLAPYTYQLCSLLAVVAVEYASTVVTRLMFSSSLVNRRLLLVIRIPLSSLSSFFVDVLTPRYTYLSARPQWLSLAYNVDNHYSLVSKSVVRSASDGSL